MAYETTTNAAGVGTTTQVVVGLFNDANDAHKAVTELRANGFGPGQIGAAFRGRSLDRYANTGDAATSTRAIHHDRENWWEKVKDAFRSDDKVEGRREAAADSTLNTDPYAPGEYEYEFSDNEFEGSLVGTGIPSDRAAYLTRNLKTGGAIVTVRDADRAPEAEQILSSNGGKVRYEDIAGADLTQPNVARSNYGAADVAGADTAVNRYSDPDVEATDAAAMDAADSTGREITDTGYVDRRPVEANSAEDWNETEMTGTGYAERRSADVANSSVDRVQLFGEVLRVHKERISRGEVRVRKDVISENQSIEVPITREELVLERVAVPANTPATSASIGSGQEIRVPLSEDSVRLEKQPVVREEVLVGKREVEDVARVGDDVRHEELRVDSDAETPKRTATGEELPDERRRHG
ncbi:MAG TPA: YsnF/AvaK domain-containing protein [Acidobacteriaceae bacterium]|nr:YsnF/AvaK domain-containing protein [Acidobacteriaceae bacterium]